MKNCLLLFLALFLVSSCDIKRKEMPSKENEKSTSVIIKEEPSPSFTLKDANKLIELPLQCVEHTYPYKLGQTLGSASDLKEPKELHPIFYGCFDWHSAVHGYWSMVTLLDKFPDLDKAEEVRAILKRNITKENVAIEVAYFKGKHNKSFERTYGWAWLLKLSEALHTWEDPLARELESNLAPLSQLIVNKYIEFLPKLVYPIRVGEHTNTAFGLTFAYDYAVTVKNGKLASLIEKRAKEFYAKDSNCPISWEPSGYDFLSPCLEEIDIMLRVLPREEFTDWLTNFMPQLSSSDYALEVGRVSDRTDGKLVHLDGLNFSRAWVLYSLANNYPEYSHLTNVANMHVNYSLPNLVGDSYEGGHWLGSFAIYALTKNQ
ncbi:DUF2891 domain-containing protein [Patiriisocius hiemis]|uniref:DUF2891 domain-containing protein n=1 Tax=Patiriisocius hiemis TaxID=3075604 RepID=A0ABU2YB49_9FLAO|nr:DUF2891 domain-containing protein [Constantimarinum sp. W242]MDT0555015.1 DUF2891 domain-containing protein [Constantimarinum sp. W242]